jgi:hypothetical protein
MGHQIGRRAVSARRVSALRGLVVLLCFAVPAPAARATSAGCRDAIAAGAARAVQATVKALAACARRQVACDGDPRTVAALARAGARLEQTVAKHCCGADRVCGSADDEGLAGIGWDAGYCPNLDRGDCNALIADPSGVAGCLACIGRAAAGGLVAATTVAAPARCATAVAKESARLMTATSKALARCWKARGAGRHANPCPLPGDGAAGPAIAAATARATARICKACGGADRACGGSDDLAPASIGFPATCPAVAVPDGPSCGGGVGTMADLVQCLACVAGHEAGCADRAAVPAFDPYPPECAAPPGTCAAGLECTSGADCPAGYACLDNGSGTTRYCVGAGCTADAECTGGAVCRQYCTFAGCTTRRCVCPGFACGADEVCIDDGGLACRQLCTQDSDCPPPLGVCVNSTFGSGLCISSTPCQ